MSAAQHTHHDLPPVDDPQVKQAMHVYDSALNDDERREVFRSVYRAVTAWRQTSDVDHLTALAESVDGLVIHETNQPGTREKIRNRPRTIAEAGGLVETEEVVRLLQE